MVTKNPRPTPDYKQLETGIGNGTAQEFKPVGFVRQGAKSYQQKHAAAHYKKTAAPYSTKGLDTLQVDPQRGHAQYLEYRDQLDNPPRRQQPDQSVAYVHMRGEVRAQYEHMTTPEAEGGMGMTHSVHKEDPYPDAASMASDVRDNKHIKTMSTKTTGGHNYFT